MIPIAPNGPSGIVFNSAQNTKKKKNKNNDKKNNIVKKNFSFFCLQSIRQNAYKRLTLMVNYYFRILNEVDVILLHHVVDSKNVFLVSQTLHVEDISPVFADVPQFH